MKWIETKVVFEGPNLVMVADLVASAFSDQGVQGVVIDDPDLEPQEGWGDGAVARPSCHAVTGYFADTPNAKKRRMRFAAAIERLGREVGANLHIGYRSVDEEDWAESWKAFFWPQKITDSIVIKPTWRPYDPTPGETVIEIDPGMAFGTGTHPTTSLCIALLEKYVIAGKRFLDIGTGSGILMVAAAKLGAGHLTGVDNDEVAVGIARENLTLNWIEPDRYDLITGNLSTGVSGRYELVTANILTEVILSLLDDIGSVLSPGAVFIGSGITEENTPRVVAKMAQRGLTLIETVIREQWAAVVGRWEPSGPPGGNRP